jgi:cyclopropane-fatty-acyl-phospholipid synthase
MQLARRRDAAPIVRDYVVETQRRYRAIEPERLKMLAGGQGATLRSAAGG